MRPGRVDKEINVAEESDNEEHTDTEEGTDVADNTTGLVKKVKETLVAAQTRCGHAHKEGALLRDGVPPNGDKVLRRCASSMVTDRKVPRREQEARKCG
jgi:hypothetical protein